jgi:hypothetical protein
MTSVVALWVARAAWLAVAVFGGTAIGDALADSSRPVQVVGTTMAWIGFAAGAAALALTGVLTLTAVRVIVPGALVVAVIALLAGAGAGPAIALIAPAVIASGAAATAEFGRCYIQASAYGDEERFGLRPPLGYLGASALTWIVASSVAVLAPMAWAARWWVAAPILTVAAVGAALLLPGRWHQLSRRWLVLVPAGVVVHDPVVLADTLMMPKATIAAIGIDDTRAAAERAADLTGPVPGVGVEIRLAEAATAVVAGRDRPNGTAIHLTACVVAPSRPGAFLHSAARRGLPIA